MTEVAIAIIAFVAGFLLGNLSKIELRAILIKVITWQKGRAKNKRN